MATVAFDTLKFVERLKAAGVPEAQAKAMTEAQQEALSESVATQLATNTDLGELRLDVIKWMVGLGHDSNFALKGRAWRKGGGPSLDLIRIRAPHAGFRQCRSGAPSMHYLIGPSAAYL